MPRVFTINLINNAKELITNGMTLKEAAANLSVNPDILSKYLRSGGFEIPKFRAQKRNRNNLPDEEIISMYTSGISEKDIAIHFGVSRSCIKKRLCDKGIERRGLSEAGDLRYVGTTLEYRQAITKAANNALRGRSQSRESRIKRAITIVKTKSITHGLGEREFADILSARGIEHTTQKAIDIYSIDIMVGSVAVEFSSGDGYTSSEKFLNKLKYLAEAGIMLIVVITDGAADTIANADYIISRIDVANSNPTALGEYWVIRSRLDNFTRYRNELGQFAAVRSAPKSFTSCSKRNVCP